MTTRILNAECDAIEAAAEVLLDLETIDSEERARARRGLWREGCRALRGGRVVGMR